MHTHMHARAHTHIHTHTHSLSLSLTHTHTLSLTHTYTHTHTHTLSLSHTHTHTHTHLTPVILVCFYEEGFVYSVLHITQYYILLLAIKEGMVMTLRPMTSEHPPCYCYGLWEVKNKDIGVYSHHIVFIPRFIKTSEMFGNSK